MTDEEYQDAYEAGIRAAHDSLEPLMKVLLECSIAYELTKEAEDDSELIARLHNELQPRLEGITTDEDQIIN